MADVSVAVESADDPMRFAVTVEDGDSRSEHKVQASQSDVQRLARREEQPADFMARVFEFLLAREPKESILSSFDVSVISKYFPEFEREISQ
jgi:hypothetical protein